MHGPEGDDLEVLPPAMPAAGTQLATPFGIQISEDDSTLVGVAAGSSRIFALDATTGAVLGRADIGAIPRSLALQSDSKTGAPLTAWVFNAVEDSISVVDVSNPASPVEVQRIALEDPTPPDVKRGRIAFHDARGSTTGTFACASCHPDGNVDQLLWNLGPPRCLTPGCDQTQPRTTQPIRGLRDTLPLHWDGVPGDPYGGINAVVTGELGIEVDPTCTDEHSCFRDLVDGAMAGTMCDQAGCPTGEDGLLGAFDEAERDAISVFLRSVSYPPARSRRLDDQLSDSAWVGLGQLLVGPDEEHPGCSRAGACHALPFYAGTNTPSSGFDAPTFRGMTDRHLLLPNGRAGMFDILSFDPIRVTDWDPANGPDELTSLAVTFGSPAFPNELRDQLGGAGPFDLFQFFEEGSVGFSGAFGRQVTLDSRTTSAEEAAGTASLLDHLERADLDGVVDLRVSGVRFAEEDAGREELSLVHHQGTYWAVGDDGAAEARFSSEELVALASKGSLVATVTARLGNGSDVDHPQPALWLPAKDPDDRLSIQALPELDGTRSMTMYGRHVVDGAQVLIDGRAFGASVTCQSGGALPSCDDEALHVELDEVLGAGQHTLQLATPGGLVSNEIIVIAR